jgi:hypothetical protein
MFWFSQNEALARSGFTLKVKTNMIGNYHLTDIGIFSRSLYEEPSESH